MARRFTAVLALLALAAALAVVLGRGSTGTPAKNSKNLARLSVLEGSRAENEGGAAAEAYTDRAYPAENITIEQIQGAISANAAIQHRGSGVGPRWDFLGPDTLNVDRLGTQSFIKGTQWSGRVTALAVSPKCKAQECTLYTAAAGGGVWRTTNALAPTPSWKYISEGIPTNAIGSITIDPTDPTGKTIYVGTGEANGSGDSEAGLGLYKTTDGGGHWSLVPGSFAAANNRSIGGVAVDPADPSHIVIVTRSGAHGISSNVSGSATIAPAPPATGVYNSTDGGATFTLVQPGTFFEVKFDPLDSNTVYAAQAAAGATPGGLQRSTADGASGSWQLIFSGNRQRYTFSPVVKDGKTRIYLADASGAGAPTGAQVYRVDDASQPAATLTASSNAAWTRLSNPTDGTPGFAVYNYCNTPLVGSQCFYDMFVMSPADNPDMVVVGGLMHYEELKPYAAPGGMRGNGRAVLMSMDSGATWTDVTNDAGGEAMHPDQHALAFVPGNPDRFFVGSDGGVIRTSGAWTDASADCDDRNLASALFLQDCKMWLKQIPTRLDVINAGLATLQMNSISISPFNALSDALAGTQDNGTLAFSGSPTWFLPLTGDGGDSGFDAVDPNIHFHTYTGGQLDINYNGNDPKTWLWIGDRLSFSGESFRFYAPYVADPLVTKTIFAGGQHVWRTTNLGGDRTFLEQHCNTAAGEFGTSDQLFTGNCGTDWFPLGGPTLTSATLGTKSGGNLTAVSRGRDAGTLWTSTSAGRVFVSKNANTANPADVTFTRIDTATVPTRTPTSIYVDPTNANHAIVTFSGYESITPTLPGHVFDVVYDQGAGTATWTNISHDLLDQPVGDAVLDVATGDVYVSTDFGVNRLAGGTETWIPAAAKLPQATVSGLTLASAANGDRWLYAATHGRGAWRLRLN